MRNRILSFILALCMAVSIVGTIPIIVSAEEYSGTCGENVTWELDTETGVLTISGTGAMTDYYTSISTAPWYSYRDFVITVVIEDGVTSIGDWAFYKCDSLTSVTIGDGVTSIGYGAFYECDGLTSVTIGDRVTSIGEEAFYGCTGLTSVTIPDSVTSIGDAAFALCYGLTKIVVDENNEYYCSVNGVLFNKDKTTLVQYPARKTNTTYTIPDSVTSIGVGAFVGCDSLKSVTIPDSVTSIGGCAFSNCSSLTSVEIPDSVTSIGELAFSECYSLTSVEIPDSVTSIRYFAFYNCESLTSVTIPDSVTSIENSAFAYCYGLTSVTIGDSVTSIGYAAFERCDSLKSVEIPDSVISIGDWAFSECDGLTSVTIGDSVTSIGYAAFNGCDSLKSVEIPDSVTSIGDYAFDGCESLTDVYYIGTKNKWNKITIGSYNTYLRNATLHFVEKRDVIVTIDGEEVETYGSIVLGTDNGNGTYSLPENVVGYYIDDKFVDAGKFDVSGGEVITTVYFNATMVNGAQVRCGGGLDENGKVTSSSGLRFLAQVDRSNFDGVSYGMKITAEGSDKETIVEATKWQNDTTFTVALTNMVESNYIRKFTATPFVKVKYDDGTEKTIYGTGSATRSIYQVASGLLKADDEIAKELSDVLNAYANQTGIRLVVVDGELKANTSYTESGAYELEENELHFAVSDAAYNSDENAYSVILTAQGNAQIITDNDFWYEYIRINNNNSLIKDKVTVERVEGSDKAVKVTFFADGLIERPSYESNIPNEDDNITTDPADDDFDGEAEWN